MSNMCIKVGEKLRKLREEKLMSISDLSDKIGCSPDLIHDVEVGKEDVYLSDIVKVAKGLGKTIKVEIADEPEELLKLRHIRMPYSPEWHTMCFSGRSYGKDTPCVKFGTWHTVTCKACLDEAIRIHKQSPNDSKFSNDCIERMIVRRNELLD